MASPAPARARGVHAVDHGHDRAAYGADRGNVGSQWQAAFAAAHLRAARRGASDGVAQEIAARTVNKERARAGEAKRMNIKGRSKMNTAELERAVSR